MKIHPALYRVPSDRALGFLVTCSDGLDIRVHGWWWRAVLIVRWKQLDNH